MYPPQLSFIPVTVAITRFIEANGFGGNYPFWYFGTTPVKYLIGPVAPGILIGLHKVFPSFSLFDLSLLSVVSCQLLMAVGWGVFAWRLTQQRRYCLIVTLLLLLLPWHWVSVLGLGEVSAVLAGAITPWVLLSFVRSVRQLEKTFGQTHARGPVSRFLPASARSLRDSRVNLHSMGSLRAGGNPSTTATPRKLMLIVNGQWSVVLPAALFAILLLTNTTAAIPAVFGILILGAVQRQWKEGLKKGLLVILGGWAAALLWYGPGFWWTTFTAPSIGGSQAVISLVNLFNLLRSFVPVVLALLVVRWGIRPKTDYGKFVFTWLLLFGSLTLFRFMADPDFWMDWTSWMTEVEVGLALLAAKNFQFTIFNFHSIFKLKFNKFIFYFLFSIYVIGGWIIALQNRDFWMPRGNIDNTAEYKIAKELEGMVKPNETVFVSGTTAFWLNSLADVAQVRGGRDEASVDDKWRDVAWEMREATSGEDSVESLRALGVNYLVVHTDESKEYYHDFKFANKFEGVFSLVKLYDQDGDGIYRLRGKI